MNGHFPDERGPSPSSSLILPSKAKGFLPLGKGEHPLDGPRRAPGFLPRAFRPTGAAREHPLGAPRPPILLHRARRASAWGWVRRSQPRDPAEDAAEQLPRHRHLRRLEEDQRELSRATILKLAHSLPAEEPLRRTFLSAPFVCRALGTAEQIRESTAR